MVLENLSNGAALNDMMFGDLRRSVDTRLLTVDDYIRPASL